MHPNKPLSSSTHFERNTFQLSALQYRHAVPTCDTATWRADPTTISYYMVLLRHRFQWARIGYHGIPEEGKGWRKYIPSKTGVPAIHTNVFYSFRLFAQEIVRRQSNKQPLILHARFHQKSPQVEFEEKQLHRRREDNRKQLPAPGPSLYRVQGSGRRKIYYFRCFVKDLRKTVYKYSKEYRALKNATELTTYFRYPLTI